MGRPWVGPGQFDGPAGVAVDAPGAVYVADFYNHRIQKFTADGRFVREWGGAGRRSGRFHYPTGVAIGQAGEIFIADAYNQRVQKFTPDGAYLTSWGGMGYGLAGSWSGWFRLAKAVTVDRSDHVYVADAFNRRIQKFTADGRLVGIWGTGHELSYAAGIAADADGRLYVSDFFQSQVWTLDCR